MTPDEGTHPDYADYDVVAEGTERPDLEWIGVAGGSHDGRPRLYDPESETAYKGSIDHENERVVVDPESGRYFEEEAISIEVEMIEEWEWLSPYAREHASE